MTDQQDRIITVSVLGTGIMGFAMARNLCRAGFDVRVWNRTRAKAEPLAADGARVTDTAAEAVDGAEVVLTMLHDGAATLSAMRAAEPSLRSGTVWIQSGTTGLDGLPPLTGFARERGLSFVDAPVLGTQQPAETGQLVVMASGPATARERAEPVLAAIGRRTLWLGDEAGAGSRLKLVCNSWALAVTHGAAEAMALARALDVDPQRLLDALEGGTLDMPYLRIKAEVIRSDDYTPTFAVDTAEKDARLILAAAERADVRLDLAMAGAERLRRASDHGHGREDTAASYFASFPPAAG
ncbi:NAD(P)-dependent oxidoreductase [Streptomyces sp. PT12]|uniref:NAD(P)-dependent oxidoreductase n=1 Tax=Streptomyces sp. PT12 TaxID=1510197 RepID=UPI000DE2C815|nr:NAD(P)-dependent oxidoreductase [Streptomyces sp. PT12]RBM19003.1 3-hydroxyisobutyrate dehydrogenase [Streptomyces sp. PT12]